MKNAGNDNPDHLKRAEGVLVEPRLSAGPGVLPLHRSSDHESGQRPSG